MTDKSTPKLCNICEYPVGDPRCIHWGESRLVSHAEHSARTRLPSMPPEIQEWCWHLDLHVTEHDERHAALALRTAWPPVSAWLRSVVRPPDQGGVAYSHAEREVGSFPPIVPEKCVYPEECKAYGYCIRPGDHDKPEPCAPSPAELDNAEAHPDGVGESRGRESVSGKAASVGSAPAGPDALAEELVETIERGIACVGPGLYRTLSFKPHEWQRIIAALRSRPAQEDRRDARRWTFALKHGFPRCCYNPQNDVTYWYMQGFDTPIPECYSIDTPTKAIDAAMSQQEKRDG